MRWWLLGGLLFFATTLYAQDNSASALDDKSAESGEASAPELPDSPGSLVSQSNNVIVVAKTYQNAAGILPPCRVATWKIALNTRATVITPTPDPDANSMAHELCPNRLDPQARFLDTTMPIPMSPAEKGMLAIHDVLDPFTAVTILGSSAVTIGSDPDTAYGPGMKGFAKLTGISYVQVATGEFFATFLIPSIVHEDPHYHRMPDAPFPRRLLHSISRTVIAQHDLGGAMPNYAILLTYPISAEISNLYVPGLQTDGRSTGLRILTGYALDPVNNLIIEFLPDVAKRIHIRVVFVQQILNKVAAGPTIAQQ
jgi:hypothetical protein